MDNEITLKLREIAELLGDSYQWLLDKEGQEWDSSDAHVLREIDETALAIILSIGTSNYIGEEE